MREPTTIRVDRTKKKAAVKKLHSLGITYEAFVERLHEKVAIWPKEEIFKIMLIAVAVFTASNNKQK